MNFTPQETVQLERGLIASERGNLSLALSELSAAANSLRALGMNIELAKAQKALDALDPAQ